MGCRFILKDIEWPLSIKGRGYKSILLSSIGVWMGKEKASVSQTDL